jgi:hypothetical protein
MSLTALPVSVSDLTNLQQGIQFFTNTAEATAEAAAINAPGSTQSVFTYAATLLNDNLSTSQVWRSAPLQRMEPSLSAIR